MKTLPPKKAPQAQKLQLVRTGIKAGAVREQGGSIRRIPVFRPGIGRKG